MFSHTLFLNNAILLRYLKRNYLPRFWNIIISEVIHYPWSNDKIFLSLNLNHLIFVSYYLILVGSITPSWGDILTHFISVTLPHRSLKENIPRWNIFHFIIILYSIYYIIIHFPSVSYYPLIIDILPPYYCRITPYVKKGTQFSLINVTVLIDK